jgi:hypothetical protein
VLVVVVLATPQLYTQITSVRTANAGYTFAGDANHTGSNDGEDFEIGKAASVTAVTCTVAPFTYLGSSDYACCSKCN